MAIERSGGGNGINPGRIDVKQSNTALPIKERLRHGGYSIGTWMQIPDSSVAEIMGAAGYDWVAVDLEHGLFDRKFLADIFRAIEIGGSLPIARVAQCAEKDIKGALEAGAKGIIIPMIETAASWRNAVRWAKYVPVGQRGVGFSRANLFGKNFDEYFTNHNRDLIMVAQIEHVRALDNLDAILAEPELDAIMIGPYDLSCSMNLVGDFDNPSFIAAIDRIKLAATNHGIPCGFNVVAPDP